MPRQELMRWDKKNLAWQRMVKGKLHRVSCGALGLPRELWTKEASLSAANAWWTANRPSGLSPRDVQRLEIRNAGGGLAELVQKVLEGQFASKALLAYVPASEQPPEVQASAVDAASAVNATGTNPPADLKEAKKRFLANVRASGIKPKSFMEIERFVTNLEVPSPLDEKAVEKVYQDLATAYSPSAHKKRFQFFQRFVDYLGENGFCKKPDNLTSKLWKFKTKKRTKVKEYELPEVQALLATLPERCKLYALLCLNTGMTQVDLGALEHSQINNGYLTRKRVKTEDEENVPTVSYKLWPETLDLLEKETSNHPVLVLTSKRNTPLYVMEYNGDKVKQLDGFANQWNKAGATIPLSAFRSIGSSLIDASPFGIPGAYYLGHSPKTVAEIHYFAHSKEKQKKFDKALSWLGEQICAKLTK